MCKVITFVVEIIFKCAIIGVGDDMELNDAIASRRSIRKFKKESVGEDILIEGIKSAILAPSAHNRQPWKFYVVTEVEKNQIADALIEKTKDIDGHTGVHTAGVIKEASRLIVVYIDNRIEENRDMDMLSIGAAIQNMLLRFTDMGYGSVWIANTNIVKEDLKQILGFEFETVSTIAVGVADQAPNPRPRKPLDEVLIIK